MKMNFKATMAAIAIVSCTACGQAQGGFNTEQSIAEIGFKRTDIISAVANQDFQMLNECGLECNIYLSALTKAIEDPMAYYRAPGIDRVVDRRLSYVLSQQIATNPGRMDEVVTLGNDLLVDIIKGMAAARSSGATVAEEITAITTSAQRAGGGIGEARILGEQDGITMLYLFNQSPDAFNDIYGNLLAYAGLVA